VSGNNVALLVAIPSLLIAIGGLVNGLTSRKEVKGKAEEIWMTLTKESTDLVIARLEELKRDNLRLKEENKLCQEDMENLKLWLQQQGIKVPPTPKPPPDDDGIEVQPH